MHERRPTGVLESEVVTRDVWSQPPQCHVIPGEGPCRRFIFELEKQTTNHSQLIINISQWGCVLSRLWLESRHEITAFPYFFDWSRAYSQFPRTYARDRDF